MSVRTSMIGALLVLLGFAACDNPTPVTPPDGEKPVLKATGAFLFDSYDPLSDKPIMVYYHVPENATTESPVLLVFHGAGRDALESRDQLIKKANEEAIIVLVPEFSDEYYPGGDAYNLGNIFRDGDHPSPATLNPESEWTFSVIDPLFYFCKEKIGFAAETYDVFGHSAGAQFAHRLLMFKPQAKFHRIVSASAGWYTMPDSEVNFPYGLKASPAETADHAPIFAHPLTVIVGTADNDPNASGLRHNSQADAQGDDRLERAQYFYNQSKQLAQDKGLPFNWQFKSLPKVEHDFGATSTAAVNLLYN